MRKAESSMPAPIFFLFSCGSVSTQNSSDFDGYIFGLQSTCIDSEFTIYRNGDSVLQEVMPGANCGKVAFSTNLAEADLTIDITKGGFARSCPSDKCVFDPNRGGFPSQEFPVRVEYSFYIPFLLPKESYYNNKVSILSNNRYQKHLYTSITYSKKYNKNYFNCEIFDDLNYDIKKYLIGYCIEWSLKNFNFKHSLG